jgi:hypothetical protein
VKGLDGQVDDDDPSVVGGFRRERGGGAEQFAELTAAHAVGEGCEGGHDARACAFIEVREFLEPVLRGDVDVVALAARETSIPRTHQPFAARRVGDPDGIAEIVGVGGSRHDDLGDVGQGDAAVGQNGQINGVPEELAEGASPERVLGGASAAPVAIRDFEDLAEERDQVLGDGRPARASLTAFALVVKEVEPVRLVDAEDHQVGRSPRGLGVLLPEILLVGLRRQHEPAEPRE